MLVAFRGDSVPLRSAKVAGSATFPRCMFVAFRG